MKEELGNLVSAEAIQPSESKDAEALQFFRSAKLFKDRKATNPILEVIEQFVADIRSIAYAGPFTVSMVEFAFSEAAKRQQKFFKQKAEFIDISDQEKSNTTEKSIKIKPGDGAEFKDIMNEVETHYLALEVLPRSLFVTHVSQFDAYLGRLIKAVLVERREILSAKEVAIEFKELMKFSSIEDAQDFVIDKEVDGILRQSHYEQLLWFEKILKIEFLKTYDSIKEFIEVTERRNLCVHTDARVSRQYIGTCEKHGAFSGEPPKIGDRLMVGGRYLQQAARILLEVGFFIGQKVARKLRQQEVESANSQLTEITYDLIIKKRYKTTTRLLEYSLKEFSDTISESGRLISEINLANSFRLQGEQDKALAVLATEEWESKATEYHLGSCVLRGDFKRASYLMKRIGTGPTPDKHDYRDWPLFSEFRQSKEFLDAYREIFKEDFFYENKSLEEKIGIVDPAVDPTAAATRH
jgi:hypothetical protein